MREKIFIVILLTFLAIEVSYCQSIYFKGGNVYNASKFHQDDFYIIDGNITFLKPEVVDTIIDISGKYIIPPFGEAHNHSIDQNWELDRKISNYLSKGIFYYKNPNSIPKLTTSIKSILNHPKSIDVVFANGGLTGTGGHPKALYESIWDNGLHYMFPGQTKGDLNGQAYHTIDSENELNEKWTMILDDKPEFIKIYLLYSEEYDKRKNDTSYVWEKGLNPDLVPLIVSRAHEADLRVTAHIETAHDFHVAVTSGVDEICHLPAYHQIDKEFNYKINESDALQAFEKNIYIIPTYSLINLAKSHQKQNSVLLKEIKNIQIHNLELLRKNQVKIAIGCDDYTGTSMNEFDYLKNLGIFSNKELLQMFTKYTLSTIFPKRKIGEIREGYEASFLILNKNPMIDIDAIRDIDIMVKDGLLLIDL